MKPCLFVCFKYRERLDELEQSLQALRLRQEHHQVGNNDGSLVTILKADLDRITSERLEVIETIFGIYL